MNPRSLIDLKELAQRTLIQVIQALRAGEPGAEKPILEALEVAYENGFVDAHYWSGERE